MKNKSMIMTVAVWVFVSILTAHSAWASLDEAKVYKKVFGTEKPKCQTCHVDKLPKKDDGKHELNEYGKKLVAAGEKLDEEVYKKVGPNPDATF